MMGVFVSLNEHSRNHMSRRNPIGYVIQENGCWEWVGARDHLGYGRIQWRKVTALAHRVVYEMAYGPISEELHLDHFYCNNPSCVNPDHVRPVTPRENALRSDSVSARWMARTHCRKGHPLTAPNLAPSELRVGVRRCRTCKNAWARAYHHRAKAAQDAPQGANGARKPSGRSG